MSPRLLNLRLQKQLQSFGELMQTHGSSKKIHSLKNNWRFWPMCLLHLPILHDKEKRKNNELLRENTYEKESYRFPGCEIKKRACAIYSLIVSDCTRRFYFFLIISSLFM
uniref:ATP-dependent helicase/nuclease subunit A n=1 Tax=Anthurium amnicola TaxID=1678845 RepID=A0A1D1ZG54_9ARAE